MRNILSFVLALFCGSAFAQVTGNATGTVNQGITGMAGNLTSTDQQGVSQVFEAGKSLPPATMIPGSNPSLMSQFQILSNNVGMPIQITAAKLEMAFVENCLSSDTFEHRQVRLGEVATASLIVPTVRLGEQQQAKIRVDMSGQGTFRCIGVVIASASEGKNLTTSALVVKLINHLKVSLISNEEVVLLSHRGYWAGGLGTSGVSTATTGGGSTFRAHTPLVSFTFGGGLSSANGSTAPFAQVGIGFLILTKAATGEMGAIDFNIVPPTLQRDVSLPTGGNGVKAEATKPQ